MLSLNKTSKGRDYESPKWMTIFDEDDQPTIAKVLVASVKSKGFIKASKAVSVVKGRRLSKLSEKVRRGHATESEIEAFDKLTMEISIEGMAKGMVKDWEGIFDIDEETEAQTPIPCDYEGIRRVLEECEEFRDQIATFAGDPSNYGSVSDEDKAEASGN